MVDGSDEDFALKLEGNGITIDRRVNRQIATAVIAAVFGGGVVATPVEGEDVDDRPRKRPALSPREFLTESRASSKAEQITALGHYVCAHEAKENFSKDDLKESFRRAHAVIPKNFPRDIGTAIKLGWVHESPGRAGLYYVTNTGMELVETKFGRTK